jgi:hypothetical protein
LETFGCEKVRIATKEVRTADVVAAIEQHDPDERTEKEHEMATRRGARRSGSLGCGVGRGAPKYSATWVVAGLACRINSFGNRVGATHGEECA